MKKFYITLLYFLLSFGVSAQFATDGSGNCYSLDSLVSISGGSVTGNYEIHTQLTISDKDTLMITTDELITVAEEVEIKIFGTLICKPPTQIVFEGEGDKYFKGIDINDEGNTDYVSHSYISKTTIKHSGGVSLKYSNDIIFEQCTFEENNKKNTTAAIGCFKSSPIIRECKFINNEYCAVASGASSISSPRIEFCTITGNVTANQNRPQINLGSSASGRPIIIYGNTITGGGYGEVGGISVAVFTSGEINAIIKNNIIKNNRYGINVFGKNNDAVISNNNIVDNTEEDDPNSGGSGIACYGYNTNKPNIYRNKITGNLWGITVINEAVPNMGSDANTGFNYIVGNGNNGKVYELYNNTAGDLSAVNNYWGGSDAATAEAAIFHKVDSTPLGTVTFMPILTTPPSFEADLLAFSVFVDTKAINGVINNDNHTITLSVPVGSDISELTADFQASNLATVEFNRETLEANVTKKDYNGLNFISVIPQSGSGTNYKLIVNFVIDVTGISLSETSHSLAVGEDFTLTATITPSDATNTNVIWTSSDATVAAVDNAGKVTAVKGGSATITATSEATPAISATCDVTVIVPVTGISLSETSHSLAVGEDFSLTATITPSDATNTNIIWTSSDATVATVDNAGKVTAVKSGSATITATSEAAPAISATCDVTVVVGIDNIDENIITVYPNPSDGVFNIKVDGSYDMEIFDASGRKISRKEVSGNSTIELKTKGVYLLQFSKDNSIHKIQKIIIK